MVERLGRYTLVRPLAQGGMAEVFHARTEGPGGFEKDVALKRILEQLETDEDAESFAQLFMDEARIAARLAHPNVVQVFDFGEADGSYFLAMELLEGKDLAAVLRATKRAGVPVPLVVAAHSIAEAAAGLGYAHSLKDSDGSPLRLVHRDVSPSNLFLTRHGEVKVLDFGIAKAEGQLHVTHAGTLKGKHAYVPPEQIHGQALTAQADIWALGVTLYELCTGVRFFQRVNPVATLRAILGEELPPLSAARPDAPEALDAILRRCVARDLKERYQSCAELRRDLQELLGSVAGRDMVAAFVRYVEALESGEDVPPPKTVTFPNVSRAPAPVFPAPPPTPPPFVPAAGPAFGQAPGIAPPQMPPEGELSASTLERGVRGTLDQLAIPDVVQMIEMGKRSAVVDVWPEEGGAGRLELERGSLRYAVFGSLVGDDAFFALCALQHGTFHLVYEAPSGAANVSSPTGFLLLEAMRRMDEANVEEAPAVGAAPTTPLPFASLLSTGAPLPPFAASVPSLPAADSSAAIEEPSSSPTVKALLARVGALPAAVVVLVLRDVLREVAASFGDLRVAPSTVVIEGGRAVLSAEHDDDDEVERAAYESPEEAAAHSLDMLSRSFSAATLAVEMLSGESPLLRPTALATREALQKGQRPLVLERAGAAPVLLATLLERMWRRAAEGRPQSPTKALEALEPLARRVEELYPSLLTRLVEDPEGTKRTLVEEQVERDLTLAAELAKGDSEQRRRAAFTLLRVRAASPGEGRAGARLLRMAQEEGWFLSGPPSPSLTALVEAIAEAPEDLTLLTELRHDALDEGRFLHVGAVLARLMALSPDDADLARALTTLTGDPGAPFGLADVSAEPSTTDATAQDSSPPPEAPDDARPSLPPVKPLAPVPARRPTSAPSTLVLPPATPHTTTTITDGTRAQETHEGPERGALEEQRPPTRRVAILVGVLCALALALVGWRLWAPSEADEVKITVRVAAAPASREDAAQQNALEQAMASFFDDEPAAAVRALQAVVALDPASDVAVEARFSLAQAHARAGNDGEAAQVYREILARTPADDERHRRAQRLLDGLEAR